MKTGDLIAVNRAIYEYLRYDEVAKVHLVSEVGIDCDGILTATHIMSYLYPNQLAEGIDKIDLSHEQWDGIVAHILRQDYDLETEELTDATEDIVNRCFAYGTPKFSELTEYIADYLNR